MGLTTSLYTGLSGLNANATTINVAGNNIANSNTTAFKSERADFQTQISHNLRRGSAPTAGSGGSNPAQVGLGVRLAGIGKNFTPGSVQPTGVDTDMAIDGNGFFMVEDGGATKFTRAGSFRLDRDSRLVMPSGARVQGFGVDSQFNVIDGPLQDITIPLDRMSIVQATGEAKFAGNLNATGPVATQGSIHTSSQLFADPGAATPATGATALTALFNADGNQLLQDGEVLTATGIAKGSAMLPDQTFQVGAANTTGSTAFGVTLQDFVDFLRDITGIDTAVNGAAQVNDGRIVLEGNAGEANGLDLNGANILKHTGGTPIAPFDFLKTQDAAGESVRTSFVAFDSLGSEMLIDLSIALEGKNDTGTTWRFFAQSSDDSDASRILGNGTLSFDVNGRLVGTTGTEVTIDREGTGALSPQPIALTFDDPGHPISALAERQSEVTSASQDGFPVGVLTDFSVGDDGTINGVFSNSQLRALGRIVLADFVNPQGLEDVGGNLFRTTPNSGERTLIDGKLVGQALELSNVDLSNEFIHLINASTGYSANSRVVTTSDRLLQELLQRV